MSLELGGNDYASNVVIIVFVAARVTYIESITWRIPTTKTFPTTIPFDPHSMIAHELMQSGDVENVSVDPNVIHIPQRKAKDATISCINRCHENFCTQNQFIWNYSTTTSSTLG